MNHSRLAGGQVVGRTAAWILVCCICAACTLPPPLPVDNTQAETSTLPPVSDENALEGDEPSGEMVIAGARELTDTVWHWQQSTLRDGSDIQPDNPEKYVLDFQPGGQFMIRADCNRGRGTYTLVGNELTIEGIVLTRMACPEESLDGVFLEQLEGVAAYQIEDGNLVLAQPSAADSGVVLEGEPVQKPEPRSVRMIFTPASTAPENGEAAVTGMVTYRQRMALPAEAQLTVRLVDVSRADAPAEVLAEQKMLADGQQVPFALELPYEPGLIEENRTYAVQARIEVDGALWFITTTQVPVITRGNPTEVELVLERV